MSTISPGWTHDMRDTLRNLQRQTVTLTLPAVGVGGLIMLLLAINTAQPVWGVVLAFLLFFTIPLIWRISHFSFAAAAVVLIASAWAVILAVVVIWKLESPLFLFVIPVGLATMTLGTWAGLGVLVPSALIVLYPPGILDFLSPATPVTLILCLAAAWGMVWLTLYPLLTSVQWAWPVSRTRMKQ